MNKDQQKLLKELAQNTIASELGLEEPKKFDFEDEIFKQDRGVFVTLEIEGNLRGCIGNIEPRYPLWEAVKRNAHEAAFGDPRFPALTADEFKNLDIEISVLTVPEKSNVDKIRPGTDGVVIQQGVYKATYLPQVWEDIPDKDKFLSSLCLKAGLGPDTWKEEEIEVFTYEVEKF